MSDDKPRVLVKLLNGDKHFGRIVSHDDINTVIEYTNGDTLSVGAEFIANRDEIAAQL